MPLEIKTNPLDSLSRGSVMNRKQVIKYDRVSLSDI